MPNDIVKNTHKTAFIIPICTSIPHVNKGIIYIFFVKLKHASALDASMSIYGYAIFCPM